MELMQIRPNFGSIFGVKLIDFKSLHSYSRPKEKEVAQVSLACKSILIVDDSEDNLEIIKLFLSSYSGNPDLARSGAEAIKMMQTKKYDIVLMDIEMPDMNGFQVIKEMNNLHFKTPVIALTAHGMPEDRQKTKNAGFIDHITKPIDFNYLVSSIVRS